MMKKSRNGLLIFGLFAATTGLIILNGCDKDTEELEWISEKGIVISQNGTGCDFLIRLNDGTFLEPAIIDDLKFAFSEGLQVDVSYRILDGDAACSVAKPAHVRTISPIGCSIAEFWPDITGFINHPLHEVSEIKVDGQTLRLSGKLSGGCVNHQFRLVRDGTCCDTTLQQPWNFYVFYNNREDVCKTIFPTKHCWNLSNLQLPDADSVTFYVHYLLPTGPTKTQLLTYHY